MPIGNSLQAQHADHSTPYLPILLLPQRQTALTRLLQKFTNTLPYLSDQQGVLWSNILTRLPKPSSPYASDSTAKTLFLRDCASKYISRERARDASGLMLLITVNWVKIDLRYSS